MKPYREKEKVETVKTIIKEYPHLFWYENKDDYEMVNIEKAQHSSACWCLAGTFSGVFYVKVSLKKKDGIYAWEYVEGETLMDDGA